MTRIMTKQLYASLWSLKGATWQKPLMLHPMEQASGLLQKLNLRNPEPTPEIDRHLRGLMRHDGLLGLLCLRCRASHVAQGALRDLVANCARVLKATQRDGSALPELAELASFILDDEGDLDPDGPAAAKLHTPFLLGLVRDLWDPSRGELSSFTRRAVKGHREMKAHLLSNYGIASISPWAFLASAGSEETIQKQWHLLGSGSLTTAQARALLRAFLSAYKQAKHDYRCRTGKTSGWQPDHAFFLRVNPQPEVDTEEQVWSLYRFFQRWKYGPSSKSLDRAEGDADADHQTPLSRSDQDTEDPMDQALEHDNLMLSGELGDVAYRILLESITLPPIYKPAQQRLATSGERLLCVCQRQAQGRSILDDAPQSPLNQRQIACDCHTSQPTVQRDLAILGDWAKEIAIVATEHLQRLSQHPNFKDLGTTVTDTEALVASAAHVLLTPLHPGDEAPLCSAIAQHLHGS